MCTFASMCRPLLPSFAHPLTALHCLHSTGKAEVLQRATALAIPTAVATAVAIPMSSEVTFVSRWGPEFWGRQ